MCRPGPRTVSSAPTRTGRHVPGVERTGTHAVGAEAGPGDEYRTVRDRAPPRRPRSTPPGRPRGRGPAVEVDGPGQALPQGTRRLAGRGQLPGRTGARSSDSSAPTGPGKSTTIGILTTRIRPTRGRAVVAGVDVVADPVGARRVLGVVPQQNNLDRSLSVRQNLLFHASYHGVPRAERNRLADALLEQFGLADRPDGRPDDFSGGQIQRMMIARALMHAPSVLFLDEPSTGLDPAARLFLWEKVAELKAAGTTVVITTHDMDEAATLSDRVAIIDHGTLLALDTPAALVRGMASERTLDCTVEPGPRRRRRRPRRRHRRPARGRARPSSWTTRPTGLAVPDPRGGRGRRVRGPGGPGRQRLGWHGSPTPGSASPTSRTSSST